jgi:hypothetical protein
LFKDAGYDRIQSELFDGNSPELLGYEFTFRRVQLLLFVLVIVPLHPERGVLIQRQIPPVSVSQERFDCRCIRRAYLGFPYKRIISHLPESRQLVRLRSAGIVVFLIEYFYADIVLEELSDSSIGERTYPPPIWRVFRGCVSHWYSELP